MIGFCLPFTVVVVAALPAVSTRLRRRIEQRVGRKPDGVGMSTVTKKDIIDRIADRTKEPRANVRTVVQEFLNQVIVELKKGNRLEFRDFGVFEARHRSARTAQDPKTLARVEVPARVSVKFKAGQLMRDTLQRSSAAIVVVPSKKIARQATRATTSDQP